MYRSVSYFSRDQHELHAKKLLKRQSAARLFRVRQGFRKMGREERFANAGKFPSLDRFVRQRLLRLGDIGLHGIPSDASQNALRQIFGQSINRHDPTHMKRSLDGGLFLFVLRQFKVGLLHDRFTFSFGKFSKGDQSVARLDLVLQPLRGKPAATDEA